ncbi:GGDEF domain-containing protein [Komagataeibacter medellinensis]|uniref:C-di-GMP phosphodiesterase A n=2 Tax=Komagataeibacter medellinensis TaxID=1177712 RepID=G2I0E0_KOMMN|nr:EAL domain-containing protein [Komagataeibacter medellinensis]KAB8124109.1 GGDEF domain-containing protein [Komagataeibacter medellinensis]BAK84398.1 c-di-GMP phosphodiesterase A [Komagataeibacter medellinensis NBRC 3288]
MSQPNLSAEVLLSALEQAIDATIIINDTNDVIFFNNAASNLWGLDKADVLGKNVNILVPALHRTGHDAFIDRNRESGLNRIVGTSREVEFTRADGEYVCGELSLSKVITDTGRIFYMGVMKNVTDESQQRKILILQNDVLQALASDMLIQDVADLLCRRVESFVPGTVAVLMLIAPNGQLRVLASPTLPKRYRASLESLYISSSEQEKLRLDPKYTTRLIWDSYRSLGVSLGLQQCFCTPVKTRSGQVQGIFALYAREDQGRNTWPQRIVDSCIPFCALAFEQNATKEHISHLANFDSLTGLLNRSSVHKVIESMISKQDGNRQFAIFMLDIDRFRDINDALGHVYADQFLIEIAARIRAISLDGYVVSRSGGDEFVVVVPNCPNKDATTFAERLLATIAKPLQIGENTLTISCSIGISTYPDNGPDSESLLSTADVALRQAKEDGRGTFRFANLEKNQIAQDRLVLGSALRDSLAKGMLNLHYQPQVRTHTLELSGVEALSRWHHPTLGNIYPSRFIAVAEETGQIEAIGRWSLLEACRQIVKWDADGVFVPTVAVNLSAVHFRNRALPEHIAALLRDHNLKPARLTVEITESVMMDSSSDTEEVLQSIRNLGCGLSMDDFGTGYSSLSRLTRLPLTEIKIDRSFINDFEYDTNAQAVTMAVIGIGNRLGMTVVTEGVETEQQRALLEELNCDVMQGYLFAKPLAPDDLEKWVKHHKTIRAILPDAGTAKNVPTKKKSS